MVWALLFVFDVEACDCADSASAFLSLLFVDTENERNYPVFYQKHCSSEVDCGLCHVLSEYF